MMVYNCLCSDEVFPFTRTSLSSKVKYFGLWITTVGLCIRAIPY